MAEAENRRGEETPETAEEGGRKFPIKAAGMVLAAFGLQVGVVLLVFNLYRPPTVSVAAAAAREPEGQPTCERLSIVDLGTFNVTQFQKGDPLNRRQLAVSLAVALEKGQVEAQKPRVLEQKAWIGQLLDEVIGPLPMDAIHPANREPLKARLKARINERLGREVVEEVILRIQAFGP